MSDAARRRPYPFGVSSRPACHPFGVYTHSDCILVRCVIPSGVYTHSVCHPIRHVYPFGVSAHADYCLVLEDAGAAGKVDILHFKSMWGIRAIMKTYRI